MLLALILLHFTALTFANPFHKYPYVFLLDVGNEELEKLNTEQIRISKQGGSLALRYPAIGNGEDIAHVRVSGIDFGTDLKANIVEGGPGYKYVVLVLMANPGVAFDAVITVQTAPTQNNDADSLENIDEGLSNIDYQISEENDPNDSAEDLSDSAESEEASQIGASKENAELTQESSNSYAYVVNEALSGYGNNIHSNLNEEANDSDEYDNIDTEKGDENDSEQNDIHVPYRENQIQNEETNVQYDDYDNKGDAQSLIEDQSQEIQSDDDYSAAIDEQNYSNDAGNQQQVHTNLYEEFQAFKQKLFSGGYREETYPQEFIPDDLGTVGELRGNEGPIDLDEISNDEYDNEDNRKYSDTNNNNFIDSNDGSAVAY